MRKYTETVAELKGPVGAGASYKSWRAVGSPGHMPVGYWVDCEGFEQLRLLALGNGDYSIFVHIYPETATALPVTYYDRIEFKPVVANNPLVCKVVAQTLDLTGARAVGVELVIPLGVNGEATEMSLYAFLK